jgi:DNA polymerase-3 subunit alpha
MVFMRLDDVTGGIDCVVFNSTYATAAELCVTDRILVVKGRVDHKEGETKLVVQEVAAFESVTARRDVRLRIDATRLPAGTIGELRAVICDFPGESQVIADCVTSEGTKVYRFGHKFRVAPVPDFYAEVRALLGEAALA